MGDKVSITVSEPFELNEKSSMCMFCNYRYGLAKVNKCPRCGISHEDIRCIEIGRRIQSENIDDNNSEIIKKVNEVLEDKDKRFSASIRITTDTCTINDSVVSLVTGVKLFFVNNRETNDDRWLFTQIARGYKVDIDGINPIVDTWKKQNPRAEHFSFYQKDNPTVSGEKRSDIFCFYSEEQEAQNSLENTKKDENNISQREGKDKNINALNALVFNPAHRLKSVSDRTLMFAEDLIKADYIDDVYYVGAGPKPIVRIILYAPESNSNICKNYAYNEPRSGERVIKEFYAKNELTIKCASCPNMNDNCHISTAGYLFYLRKKGLYQTAIDERNAYLTVRKNSGRYKDPFIFEWNPLGGVKDIGSSEYEYALELNEKGKVGISPVVSPEEYIRITFPNECYLNPEVVNTTFFRTLMTKENLLYTQLGFRPRFSLSPQFNKKNICSKCKLDSCPFIVAGYIQFMKKTGRERILEIERESYLSERETLFKETTAEFNEVAYRAEGAEKILKFVHNESANYLYCIIQGSANTGKRAVIDQIADILYKYKKIENKEYRNVTFGQLEEELTSVGQGYSFSHLDKYKLYVVTRLDRFLNDIENGPRGKGSKCSEYDAVKMEHLMHILGSLKENTYLILVSQNDDETERFLNLNSRYRYLYSDYLIRIPDYSSEELYSAYLKGLSTEVVSLIQDEDGFRKEFIRWIGNNRKVVPFENADLSKYLANYSNMENKPVLPDDFYNGENIRERLDQMVGLESIKKQIQQFEQFVRGQQEAAAYGIKSGSTNMHMMFLGNPGTGKTVVARIIADMLYEIGILQQPKLVEVERKDLVGRYIGETAPKTADKIKEALGGVLFIDEAYTLAGESERDFGHEAIATLIKAMEDHRDNLVVIFAGYEKEMLRFVDTNSGIASRIGYTFQFEDYSPEDLGEMFNRSMLTMGYDVDADALERIEDICRYFSKRKNFGNGRFVEKLQQRVIQKHYVNRNENNDAYSIKDITISDIPEIRELLPQKDTSEVFVDVDSFIGMEDVKEQINKYAKRIEFEKKAKTYGIKEHNSNKHMVFLGNPGTGKTMMARVVAQKLFEIGVIQENKLVETDREGLVGKYVGQTAVKTKRLIESAIGGVLFIDEAYALANESEKDFGHEAIATLIKAMEDEKDNLIVIFAGYEKEMKTFLDINPGIASRVGHTILFEDYSSQELVEIFELKIGHCGYTLGDGVSEKVNDLMQYFVHVPNFGNGRFAEKITSIVIEKHSERCLESENSELICTIEVDDIPAVEEVIHRLPDGENMIRPSRITEEQNIRTAYHELGHAFLQYLYFPNEKINRITISAEGTGALGYVEHRRDEIYTQTATDLRKRISVLLAGLASEELFLGEYASGGNSDLKKATSIAGNMITHYGMSEKGMAFSDTITDDDRKEINDLLDKQFRDAREQLKQYKAKIEEAKEILIDQHQLEEDSLISIINK